MHRRTFLTAAAASVAPAIVRATSANVLKFVPQADLAVLDPIVTTAGVSRNHGNLVFDTLYGVAGPETGFAAVPQMAAGHNVEHDGLTWRIVLRDGLLFHDGQKVLVPLVIDSDRFLRIDEPWVEGGSIRCLRDRLRSRDMSSH